MDRNNMAGIDSTSVDEVVLGAMALLVEGETCEISSATPTGDSDITVAVYCDAHQQSAVVLRCSLALAVNLTGKMLELDPGDIGRADIVDATGELVNVIAGNLRGLVSSPGTMTAPFLLEQEAYAHFCGGAVNSYSVTGEAMQVLRM